MISIYSAHFEYVANLEAENDRLQARVEEAEVWQAALLAALNIGRHYVVYVRDKAAEEGWEKWTDAAPDLRTIDDALALRLDHILSTGGKGD